MYIERKLTLLQRRFVGAYLQTQDPAKSALLAGYKSKMSGYKNMELSQVRSAIEAGGVDNVIVIPSGKASPNTDKLYLMGSDVGLTKIGITNDVNNRLRMCQSGSPSILHIIAVIEAEDTHSLEMELHERFESKRVHHEWFNLSDEDIKGIINTHSSSALKIS